MSVQYALPICQICKINSSYNPMCDACHSLYWEFEKTLTAEQNDEVQMALLRKQLLPDWFNPWWKKMMKLKAFL